MIRGDIHMREAFQNWCPLGCGMLEALYLEQDKARKELILHLKDHHKIAEDRIGTILIDLEGKEVKKQ